MYTEHAYDDGSAARPAMMSTAMMKKAACSPDSKKKSSELMGARIVDIMGLISHAARRNNIKHNAHGRSSSNKITTEPTNATDFTAYEALKADMCLRHELKRFGKMKSAHFADSVASANIKEAEEEERATSSNGARCAYNQKGQSSGSMLKQFERFNLDSDSGCSSDTIGSDVSSDSSSSSGASDSSSESEIDPNDLDMTRLTTPPLLRKWSWPLKVVPESEEENEAQDTLEHQRGSVGSIEWLQEEDVEDYSTSSSDSDGEDATELELSGVFFDLNPSDVGATKTHIPKEQEDSDDEHTPIASLADAALAKSQSLLDSLSGLGLASTEAEPSRRKILATEAKHLARGNNVPAGANEKRNKYSKFDCYLTQAESAETNSKAAESEAKASKSKEARRRAAEAKHAKRNHAPRKEVAESKASHGTAVAESKVDPIFKKMVRAHNLRRLKCHMLNPKQTTELSIGIDADGDDKLTPPSTEGHFGFALRPLSQPLSRSLSQPLSGSCSDSPGRISPGSCLSPSESLRRFERLGKSPASSSSSLAHSASVLSSSSLGRSTSALSSSSLGRSTSAFSSSSLGQDVKGSRLSAPGQDPQAKQRKKSVHWSNVKKPTSDYHRKKKAQLINSKLMTLNAELHKAAGSVVATNSNDSYDGNAAAELDELYNSQWHDIYHSIGHPQELDLSAQSSPQMFDLCAEDSETESTSPHGSCASPRTFVVREVDPEVNMTPEFFDTSRREFDPGHEQCLDPLSYAVGRSPEGPRCSGDQEACREDVLRQGCEPVYSAEVHLSKDQSDDWWAFII